jgi:glycerophosphoryl diester phosphodiesterase
MASFRKAFNDGADGIEFDVRRCGDGQIVVIHDDTVNRTTNGFGLVSAFNYEDLRSFDAGDGECIPRLADVLHEFRDRSLNIELKESGLAEDLAQIADHHSKIIVSGFRPFWDDLRALSAQFEVGVLATRDDVETLGVNIFICRAKELGAKALHLPKEVVDRSLVRNAHSSSLLVRVFTVNDPRHVERLLHDGADAIFSDFPGGARQVIANARL